MTYSFISHNGGRYIEADSIAEIKRRIREHRPCTTAFHARAAGIPAAGGQAWHVISDSPHTIGPVYEGMLRAY
jgi:hypothetical protein